MPYDDQPRRLMDDWATLDRRYQHIYLNLKADNDWLPDSLKHVEFEPAPVNAPPTASLKSFLNGKRKT